MSQRDPTYEQRLVRTEQALRELIHAVAELFPNEAPLIVHICRHLPDHSEEVDQ